MSLPRRARTLVALALLMPAVAFAQNAPAPATRTSLLPPPDMRLTPDASPITRAEAISHALGHGAQSALAHATERAAAAELLTARAYPNPTLSASYSKSVPQYHATVDLPLDITGVRSARITQAEFTGASARDQLALARAAIRLDVDTLYTRATQAAARLQLSTRNAAAAESLLAIARVRRDAGDASDLDVELARVNAGQAENAAAADSLAGTAALLELQASIGVEANEPAIALADSLTPATLDSLASLARAPAPAGTPLAVSAAERDLRAAEAAVSVERRTVWSGLALSAGIENHDPTGSETGILPTVGVSVPLPLLDRRRGEIAAAVANRDRARAALEIARRESELQLARARRSLAVAVERARRDRTLVESAQRVAELSLRAYAEGAYPLASVLEAQRNARDALGQLIGHTADAMVAASTLAALSLVAAP